MLRRSVFKLNHGTRPAEAVALKVVVDILRRQEHSLAHRRIEGKVLDLVVLQCENSMAIRKGAEVRRKTKQ
jgi:hypothetical protein